MGLNKVVSKAAGGVFGGPVGLLGGLNPFGGVSAPASPDFKGAAEATAAGNLKNAELATQANRANQVNPFGSSQWTQGPDGQWTQNVSFSPGQQQLFDQTQSGMSDMLKQGPLDFGTNRQQVLDAMKARSGIDINKDRETMKSELAARGIPESSAAFDTEMARFDRRLTDANQQAEISATGQAAQEYGSQLAGRGQQMGMLGAFSPQSPQFNQFYNQQATPGADYSGAAQQQSNFDMGNYNAQMAQKNAMMQGLFGLGAAGIFKSDRRLKKAIKQIGTLLSGLPWYEFEYLWSPKKMYGVMSDEAKKLFPEAVIRFKDGFDRVNYGLIK